MNIYLISCSPIRIQLQRSRGSVCFVPGKLPMLSKVPKTYLAFIDYINIFFIIKRKDKLVKDFCFCLVDLILFPFHNILAAIDTVVV